MPSIHQFRYLLCIEQLGSIRKAAEQMSVTQPTVTAQISALENAFETKLLERTPQGTQMTPEGRLIKPHLIQLIAQYDQVCSLAKDINKTPSGTHKVGIPDTFGPYLLSEIIPELHLNFPSLRFFVREDTPHNLEVDLQSGHYDFILSPLPVGTSRLKTELLFLEPIHLIAAPDHPLRQQKQILPEDLKGEKFLVIEERHRFFSEIEELAKKHGLKILRDYAGTSLNTLRLMIGTGMGLSFLHALYVRSEIQHRNDVSILDIDFELPKRKIAMVWRQSSPQKHLYKKIAHDIKGFVAEKLSGTVELDENS